MTGNNKQTLSDEDSDIPLNHVSVRVAELAKMVKAARKRKNNVLAAKLIEQIAKCLKHY